MEDSDYIKILKQGKADWNRWRDLNPKERANFIDANLDGLNLEGYKLTNCNFYKTSLQNCNLNKTELTWSAFFFCKLNNSTIINPELLSYTERTSFSGVNIRWSSFAESDLSNVKMKGSLFEGVHLHACNLKGADISYSRIYGLSSWGNDVDETTIQTNLIITPYDEPTIRVDNFEIAQFLYLLITNKKIRNVLDTLATKVVLILGSFAEEDKIILDQIKEQLTLSNYIPVIFDFDKPASRSLTETVSTIAHIAKFIIADLTNSRSIPHELASIIPTLTSVPVIPIIKEPQTPYGMFQDFKTYRHISKLISYQKDQPIRGLIETIKTDVEYLITKLR